MLEKANHKWLQFRDNSVKRRYVCQSVTEKVAYVKIKRGKTERTNNVQAGNWETMKRGWHSWAKPSSCGTFHTCREGAVAETVTTVAECRDWSLPLGALKLSRKLSRITTRERSLRGCRQHHSSKPLEKLPGTFSCLLWSSSISSTTAQWTLYLVSLVVFCKDNFW